MFRSFLQRLVERIKSSPRARQLNRVKQRRMELERLDDRRVFAGFQFTMEPGIHLNNGNLSLVGDAAKNDGHVWTEDGKIKASLNYIVYQPTRPGTTIPVNKVETTEYDASQVSKIFFYGYDGADSFVNDTALASSGYGFAGDDFLQGGSGADTLIGGADKDSIEGRAGDDDLRGSSGDDRYLFSSFFLGSDTVDEPANADLDYLNFFHGVGKVTLDLASTDKQLVQSVYLFSGNPMPSLYLTLTDSTGIEGVVGTNSHDTIYGNARPNHMYGAEGNDKLFGKDGDDYIVGAEGNDTMVSGFGKNTLSDGVGDDFIDFTLNDEAIVYNTAGGNDTVAGTQYADTIAGSSGNDKLYGSNGNDHLIGKSGNDKLYSGEGNNTLTDGTGDDLLDYSWNSQAIVATPDGGNDTIKGTAFADKLVGTAGNDCLYGNGGNDRLFGKAGVDHVFGGEGDDWLEAGSAAEVAVGDGGIDFNAHKWAIQGATYDDIHQGGAGTCVFLSALAGGAAQGINLEGRISYLGNYVYKVKLYNADSEQAYYQNVTFDGSFSYINGKHWDPWPAAGGEEFWTVVYQRAYLKMINNIDETFTDPDYAMYAVTGRENNDGDWSSAAFVASFVDAGYVVTAGDADDTGLIHAHHSYTVMDVYQSNGAWYIKLRNPWGSDNNPGEPTYGDPNDGIIVISWNNFQGYYDFDRISIS